jgi:hypothetical protein
VALRCQVAHSPDRKLLLSIVAVLLACGGVLGIRPRQAHDHRRQQAGRQLTAPDDQTT